jgi:hypothetical protein
VSSSLPSYEVGAHHLARAGLAPVALGDRSVATQ